MDELVGLFGSLLFRCCLWERAHCWSSEVFPSTRDLCQPSSLADLSRIWWLAWLLEWWFVKGLRGEPPTIWLEHCWKQCAARRDYEWLASEVAHLLPLQADRCCFLGQFDSDWGRRKTQLGHRREESSAGSLVWTMADVDEGRQTRRKRYNTTKMKTMSRECENVDKCKKVAKKRRRKGREKKIRVKQSETKWNEMFRSPVKLTSG